MTELRLGRCLLRRWRAGDAAALVRHANDAAVARNLNDGFPHPYTPADAAAWLERAAGNPLHWAIEVEGEACGDVGLRPGEDIGRVTARIGYWLGRAHWGRGIASEALAAASERAFAELGLQRLEACVFPWNPASARVLEKCGYQREAVLRQAAIKGGALHDLWLYARLRNGAPAARRFLELSHAIEDGMVTYPGLPAPQIGAHMSRADSRSHYAPGVEFHIGRASLVGNTGTYLDAPYHRWSEGVDLDALPLERCAGLEGIVLRVPGVRAVDASHFHGARLAGRAVLVHTGWSRHWRTSEYGGAAPYLTAGAAEALCAAGAALVGIDSINIDDRADGRRPVHSRLLQAGIPIVEHLTRLEELPDEGFRFSAVAAPIRGMGSFPVRAYAQIGG